MGKVKAIIITFTFITLIVGANSGYLINFDSGVNMENRTLATCPKLEIKHLDPFPKQFEEYYVDHFMYRQQLLQWNKFLKVRIFGESPHKSVIIGSNGFLFAEKYQNSYTGQHKFTEEELNLLYEDYIVRIDWLEKRNIKHYIAIIPTKFSVYPESLPFHMHQLSGLNQTAQFINRIKNIKGINLIDLKDTLIEAKTLSNNKLFYNTDQHWNEFGAYVGYAKIIDEIRKAFPIIPKISLDSIDISFKEINGKGLAKIILMEDEFSDMQVDIKMKNSNFSRVFVDYVYPIPEPFPYKDDFQIHYKSNNDSLPKILLIRDSYVNSMHNFFPSSFSESVFIWDNWNYKLNEEIIEHEKPDIILTILIENNLEFILYKHPNERNEE
ncbi:hypothetical protein OAL26_02380 [Flavobacteriales bacterium]|jgi:hypothetical protein|nr:hypothetical protein [Flavobacteriales bacterium]